MKTRTYLHMRSRVPRTSHVDDFRVSLFSVVNLLPRSVLLLLQERDAVHEQLRVIASLLLSVLED